MVLPHYWFWWGLGWLFMPRMTIGLIIYQFFFASHPILGLVLAVIGALLDVSSLSI